MRPVYRPGMAPGGPQQGQMQPRFINQQGQIISQQGPRPMGWAQGPHPGQQGQQRMVMMQQGGVVSQPRPPMGPGGHPGHPGHPSQHPHQMQAGGPGGPQVQGQQGQVIQTGQQGPQQGRYTLTNNTEPGHTTLLNLVT